MATMPQLGRFTVTTVGFIESGVAILKGQPATCGGTFIAANLSCSTADSRTPGQCKRSPLEAQGSARQYLSFQGLVPHLITLWILPAGRTELNT
jgi:hypothetical protein